MDLRKLMVISNATERAYRRGDLPDKRRRLIGHWARHCFELRSDSAKVSPDRANA